MAAKINSAASEADSLFRRFTVAAIRGQDHSIKNDIEGKRQDLRLMVGERYRELIDAADSIMAMRQAARSIEEQFAILQDRCNIGLLRRHDNEYTDGGSSKVAEDRETAVYRVAAQIKLLVDTPEQIWFSLERALYLQSAQLYLLAKHVYANLQSGNDSVSANALDVFPVARRQWDAVSRFQAQIIQKTHQSMKFIHQSDQSIADALCAIILLENTSVEQAIRAFFDMRRQALDDLISSFDKDTTEYVEFLGEIGGLIHMTVRQAWSVFGAQEGGKSLLEESLSRLHDPSVGSRRASTAPRPTGSGPEDMQSVWLSGLFSERTNIHVMVRHLPPGLRSQTIAIPNYSISVREAGEEALTWIRDITDAAKTGVASILGKISSGQRLWTIREKVVMEMAKEESQGSKSRSHLLASSGDDNNGLHTNTSHLPWSEVSRLLLGSSFSIWDTVLREPFVERAQDIIKSAFQKIARQPADFISEKVDTFTAGRTAAPNNGTAISPWTVVVAEISSLFDRFVLEIQTDLNAFFKGAKPHVKDATSSAQFFPDAGRDSVFEQDAADLRRTFADSGVVALRSYGLGLGQLLEVHKNRALESLNNSSDMAEIEVAVDRCLLIGRLARAIVLRCRGLFALFSSPELANFGAVTGKGQRVLEKKLDADPQFVEARDRLLAISEQSYRPWLVMVSGQAGHWLHSGLEAEDWTSALGFREIWEAVSVRADTEGADQVEESMSLPVQASAPVVQVLFRICQSMNRIGGHLMERDTLRRLLASLARIFFGTYHSFLDTSLSSLSDKGALQMLFDIAFLTKVLGDTINDEDVELGFAAKHFEPGIQSSVVTTLRTLVDPIDLTISDRYIAGNVERFFYRTSVLFGPLLVLTMRALETKHNPSVHEVHNTVALSTQGSRFSLLPVIPLSSQGSGVDRPKTDYTPERPADARDQTLAVPAAGVLSSRLDSRIRRPHRKHIRLYGQVLDEGLVGGAAAGSGMSALSSLVEQGGKALLSSLGGLLVGSD